VGPLGGLSGEGNVTEGPSASADMRSVPRRDSARARSFGSRLVITRDEPANAGGLHKARGVGFAEPREWQKNGSKPMKWAAEVAVCLSPVPRARTSKLS